MEEGIYVADPGIVNTLHIVNGLIPDRCPVLVVIARLKGASTAVFLAKDPSVEGITGKLFKDNKSLQLPARIINHPDAGRVWSFFITLCTYGNQQ